MMVNKIMSGVKQSGIVKYGSFGVLPRGKNNADVMRVWFCGRKSIANGVEQSQPCAHETRAQAVKHAAEKA